MPTLTGKTNKYTTTARPTDEMTFRVQKTLRIFGPSSAALHIFAQVALILEVGAIGSWVREYWVPATRLFWSEVFSYLAILNFHPTDAEKDALTAAAFFTPLALSAAWLWLQDRGRDDGEAEYGSPAMARWTRLAAFLASIAILFFVSQQIISDALSVYAVSAREAKSVEVFSLFSIVVLGGIIVALVIFYRLDSEVRRALMIFGATIGALLEFVVIGGPVIFAAYYAAAGMGMIRSAALLVVTFCIVLTISVRPAKVLEVAAVVIGLIAASWLVEFLSRIGEVVATAPK